MADAAKANIDKVDLNDMVDWLGTGRLTTNTGSGVFESAEGLRYATDIHVAEGHRIAHVLKHTSNAGGAPTLNNPFGVFDSPAETFDLIDEAWSIRVRDNLPSNPGDPVAFEIPMGRRVGTERYLDSNGVEQTRAAEHIKVVLMNQGDTAIRTAYPVYR